MTRTGTTRVGFSNRLAVLVVALAVAVFGCSSGSEAADDGEGLVARPLAPSEADSEAGGSSGQGGETIATPDDESGDAENREQSEDSDLEDQGDGGNDSDAGDGSPTAGASGSEAASDTTPTETTGFHVDLLVLPSESQQGQVGYVPLDLVARIAAIDGVAEVRPEVLGRGELLAPNDLAPPPGPQFAASYTDQAVLRGRKPTSSGEFAVDPTTAALGNFTVGTSYAVEVEVGGKSRVIEPTLVGVIDPGFDLLGATMIVFEQDTAVSLLTGDQGYTSLRISLDGSVRSDSRAGTSVIEKIAAVLPSTLELSPGDGG